MNRFYPCTIKEGHGSLIVQINLNIRNPLCEHREIEPFIPHIEVKAIGKKWLIVSNNCPVIRINFTVPVQVHVFNIPTFRR
ncbi:hypothetical protein D3C71_1646310 [compost metagenome]